MKPKVQFLVRSSKKLVNCQSKIIDGRNVRNLRNKLISSTQRMATIWNKLPENMVEADKITFRQAIGQEKSNQPGTGKWNMDNEHHSQP